MARGYAKETMKLMKAYYPHKKMTARPISDAELARRIALVPEDTRDLTGRLFGDPIPGDKRRMR